MGTCTVEDMIISDIDNIQQLSAQPDLQPTEHAGRRHVPPSGERYRMTSAIDDVTESRLSRLTTGWCFEAVQLAGLLV